MNSEDLNFIKLALDNNDNHDVAKFDEIARAAAQENDIATCKEFLRLLAKREECLELDFLIIKTAENFSTDIYLGALSEVLLENVNIPGEPIRVAVSRILNSETHKEHLINLLKIAPSNKIRQLKDSLSSWPGRDAPAGEKLKAMLI